MQYLFIDYPLRKRIPMPENYLSRKRKTPTLTSSLPYSSSRETPCTITMKYAMICKRLQILSLLMCITQTERENLLNYNMQRAD
jgi:hypothetical protein